MLCGLLRTRGRARLRHLHETKEIKRHVGTGLAHSLWET
jgi:hypothetical protein